MDGSSNGSGNGRDNVDENIYESGGEREPGSEDVKRRAMRTSSQQPQT